MLSCDFFIACNKYQRTIQKWKLSLKHQLRDISLIDLNKKYSGMRILVIKRGIDLVPKPQFAIISS